MSQPKSILKKKTDANPRHLAVALHHANLLEDRKRVEGEVLASIMTLMDFPSAADADPKQPSASDARYFCQAVIPFQPADYDALVEERNISDKCGYALCPRPKQKARSTAKKQFVDTDHGVEIVAREKLEVWCSDDCAKRALFIKVQLNEEPAWMRQGGYGGQIELMLDDAADEHSKALPLRLKHPVSADKSAHQIAKEEQEANDVKEAWSAHEEAMAHLAIERGEKAGQLPKANKDLIKDDITEHTTSSEPPKPPSLPVQSFENTTMAIEGHIPKLDRKDDGDSDQDDAKDWDKHLPG